MSRYALRSLTNSLRQLNVSSNKMMVTKFMRPSIISCNKAFSTSLNFKSSSGLVDADLSHKLNEELKYEKEEGDSEISEEMKAYIDKMPFKITDKKGEDEIHLTRTFGNETINVIFSIKDVDVAAPELDAEEGDEESIPNPPIHATIDITKSGSGTITFNTVIEDGYFNIDLVTYYKDDKLAIEDGAEAEWKRHALYGGPVFNDLEEDLQILFEKYLEERGISTDLALFIPNYIQFKEQKEYMNWLASVHDFVKA